ncbi:MAG: 2-dehydropantoate 2-reductase N-terminal domain-containing protein [Alcanivoracaceae bacterium]|nr:2-dehydropantoate 2-reductase N-terminal domain-containing protein [Alcanivoracaceae bacterium]
MRPRILIIGSGAVAAVYAHHLVKAGCQVTFLVRDKSSANSAMPRQLHQYKFVGKATATQQRLRVITQAYPDWDQVWLTLPSDALTSPWLAEQLAVFGSDTPLISWTPDFRDDEILRKIYKGPLQHGLIGLISFHTPLPGEQTPAQGFGYLLPPRSAMLDNSRVGQQAAALLRTGGLPAVSMKDLEWFSARSTSVMVPLIAGLEMANWSLSEMRSSKWLGIACQSCRQATLISANYMQRDAGISAKLPQPLLVSMISRLAPKVMPFPLETYLQYHFSKVGVQTRQMLDHWIEEGNARGLDASALQTLRTGLQ